MINYFLPSLVKWDEPIRPNRRPHHDDTQAHAALSPHRILFAAAELFSDRVCETTMEEIGSRRLQRRTGGAFGSKPGVIEALLKEIRRIDRQRTRRRHVVDMIERYVGLIAEGNLVARALRLMANRWGARDKAELFANTTARFRRLRPALPKHRRAGWQLEVKPRASLSKCSRASAARRCCG
jgi:hypothetical protein